MATGADEKPTLLIKKFGGLLLTVFGGLLAAVGFNRGATELSTVGVLLLVGGAILLALKIVRRNQGGQLR